jgi:hypothetical protein
MSNAAAAAASTPTAYLAPFMQFASTLAMHFNLKS